MAIVLYIVSSTYDNLFITITAGTFSYVLFLYLMRGLNFISFRELLSLPKER